MSKIIEISKKRREWVNKEFSKRTKGSSMSNTQKTKLLKKLWKQARKKYR